MKNYFEVIFTEEELNEIEKYDCLFSFNVISLEDKKNRKLLDSYAYQQYLKNTTTDNAEDNKGGDSCE